MPSLQCLLQFLWSCLSHFVFEGKSMPNKTALLYPGQIHLRLECLCFLSCFYFLFCFSSLPDRYLPIWRSKTFSLFCSPCYWFWLMGIGVGVGKERQSLYLTTKIIPSPWHVQQLQREFDIWGDRGARVILIYLSIGTERIGSSKGTAEVRMSQGFRGGNILQAKKKKLFINTSERTERKTPEPASLNTWPCLKEDWTAFERDTWHGWGHDGGPSSLTTLQRFSNSVSPQINSGASKIADSSSGGPGWVSRFCIFIKFPNEAEVAVPWITLGEERLY